MINSCSNGARLSVEGVKVSEITIGAFEWSLGEPRTEVPGQGHEVLTDSKEKGRSEYERSALITEMINGCLD
jgi:hypothetical protein